ncbi:MAG: phosphodiester glycosidase family protein [Bacillota bacterium]|nr:phosphodiester glycosidase family protein [Bacillota bacterium]
MKSSSKFFIIFLVFSIFLIPFSFSNTLNEDIITETLTPSIKYIEKKQLTNNKWIIVKSLIIDISDNKTEIAPLFNNENLKVPKTLTNLCEKTNNIIGAINGDFFNPNENTAIGPVINNGDLIYNGTSDNSFNVFGITNINTPFISNLEKFNLIAKTKKLDIIIDYKNKDYTHLNNTILIDKQYNKFSIGNNSKTTVTEIVISNNKISDIRYNMSPVEILDNTFVLVIPDSKNINISNLKVGDTVTINSPQVIEVIKSIIGGGSIIVKDGQINSEFSLEIKGEHPRTAIGYTKDRKHIIMTTVEGRKSFIPGVTENELANIMIDLGADYALNLDGGGSSTLAIRGFGLNELNVMNYLSDGSQRRIYNAIGIISNYETETVNNIKATLNTNHSIINNPINIEILATDKYFNPVDISINNIEFDSTLKGDFIDSVFYPKEIGKGYIILNYNDIIIKKEINIHNEFSLIKLNNYHISLKKDESITIKPTLVTKDGYEISVDLDLLNIDLDKELITINKDTLTLVKDITNTIATLSYGDISTQFDINMINYNTKIIDDFETLKGINTVYPMDLNGRFNLFNSSFDNTQSGRLFYDFTKYPEQTRASYYSYNEPILIDESAKKIGLEVFGYLANNHWLRVKLSDSDGNYHNLTLARSIDWKDWKYVETNIPDNISKPIKIEKIYLVETDFSNSNSGLILIDNLQVKTPIKSNLNIKTNYSNIFTETMDLKYTQDNIYFTNDDSIIIDSQNFKIVTDSKKLIDNYPLYSLNTNNQYNFIKDSNKLILNLNNKNNTLINDNGEQWLFLKKYILTDSSNNLLIHLNDEFVFNDSLEKELFMSYLKKHKQKNNSNIFIISSNNEFLLTYYKGYPIINLDKDTKYLLKFNFFKNFAKFNLNAIN